MRYQQSEDEMTESLRSWLSSATERKLTQEEIDRCLEAVEKQVPLFPGEMPDFLARLRSWAEADDGKPVYMLELMRFYPSYNLLLAPLTTRARPSKPISTTRNTWLRCCSSTEDIPW